MVNSTMKDSGVEWIGEIPKEWKVTKLRNFLRTPITDGPHETPRYVDEGVPFISVNAINGDGTINRDIANRISESDARIYNEKTNLEVGDILFTKAATIGKIAIVDVVDFMIWSPIAVIKSNKSTYNHFLKYVFMCDGFLSHVSNLGTKNTQINVGMRAMEQSKVPVLSLSEQQKIADFLDEKISHIDNVIADTKKSIRDLKIYKQSFITEVVTKGLDSTVDMQDSGVEYIGKIPSHWKFSKFKYLLNSPLKYGANESGLAYDDNKPRYIRITDILEGNKLINSNRQSLDEDVAEEYILKNGDLLFARSGATAGKTYMVTKKTPRSAFAGYLIKGDVGDVDISNYVYYYTLSKSYEEWKNSVVIQATIQNIGAEKYANMFLPIPPKDEQIDIVKYLNKKVESIDLILEDKRLLLSEFESYKKSLIYEYVTGKKEVK